MNCDVESSVSIRIAKFIREYVCSRAVSRAVVDQVNLGQISSDTKELCEEFCFVVFVADDPRLTCESQLVNSGRIENLILIGAL